MSDRPARPQPPVTDLPPETVVFRTVITVMANGGVMVDGIHRVDALMYGWLHKEELAVEAYYRGQRRPMIVPPGPGPLPPL